MPFLLAASIAVSSVSNVANGVSVTNTSNVTTSANYSSVNVENVSSGSGGTTVHFEQTDNGKTSSYTLSAPAGESVDFSTTTEGGHAQVHIEASTGAKSGVPSHAQASAHFELGTSSDAVSSGRLSFSFMSNISLSLSNFFSNLYSLFGF